MKSMLGFSILAAMLAGCTPTARAPASQVSGGEGSQPPGRTLTIIVGAEPRSLALKALGQAGVTLATSRRLFNAALTLIDDQGNALPYLATALPQLNTESWRIEPDGRMETTYRLRTDAVWQDGTPLTPDDFVFSWQVYSTPDLGASQSPPFNVIQEVVTPDAQTLVVRWRRSYPDAGKLASDLPPLPRHVLGPVLADVASGPAGIDAFINNAYWTREFVGLGPYRLDRWEPASFLEGVAFDKHVLGRPKINRVQVTFITDQNTALARMLAGEAQYAADSALGNAQAQLLKGDWAPRNGGATITKHDFWRGSFVQLRPEMASPRAILDVRVRQALAHVVDRQALNGVLFDGDGTMAENPAIPPTVPYFTQLERSIAKYPLDLRRSEQLMLEAGLIRGSDGIFMSPTEGRLTWEVKTNASAENVKETSILAANWRQAGFDFTEAVLPSAQAQDGQARASFPTLYDFGTPVGETALSGYDTNSIPRPENRWSGNNRGGWSNAEFDGLASTLAGVLEPAERVRLVGQMTTLFTRDVASIPLYFYGLPVAFSSAVIGPGQVAQEAYFEWNIHNWELR
jgi:peptide/nickel transport system substrate-binding protein